MNYQRFESLSDLPGFALRRAANVMMAELADRLAILDLRISDAAVMLLIDDRVDLTSTDIGKAIDIKRANMVPIITRLENAGLIRREPIDRKSQAIILTQAGKARLTDLRSLVDAFETDLMERIPEEHRDHFQPALQALLG